MFFPHKKIYVTIKILCSIRILDESIDLPKCDSIFISNVNENSSDIKMVQRLGRAIRLDRDNPNKIAIVVSLGDIYTINNNTIILTILKLYKFPTKLLMLSNIVEQYNTNIIEIMACTILLSRNDREFVQTFLKFFRLFILYN